MKTYIIRSPYCGYALKSIRVIRVIVIRVYFTIPGINILESHRHPILERAQSRHPRQQPRRGGGAGLPWHRCSPGVARGRAARRPQGKRTIDNPFSLELFELN